MIILMGLIPSGMLDFSSNDEYDELWAQVESQESRFPQTAMGIVEKIYQKSIAENRDDQLIKAIIYRSKLSRQIKDEDPAQEILDMEKELGTIKSNDGKSIYASLLGELYHNYGIRNAYRFQDRTQLGNDDLQPNDDLVFSSLESIQRKAAEYYLQSLNVSSDLVLQDLDVLLEKAKDEKANLKAASLTQLLHLRCIKHFVQSNAFVGLPVGHLKFNGPEYFEKSNSENESFVPSNSNFSDIHNMVLWIFEKTNNDAKLNLQQRIWLETQRIDYVFRNAVFNEKDVVYISTLQKLIANNRGQNGVEYPTLDLVNYYINNADNRDQGKINYWYQAAQLISELKSSEYDSYFDKYIEQAESRIKLKEFKIELEQVNKPNSPFLSLVRYRNTPQLQYSIHRLTEKKQEELNKVYDHSQRLEIVSRLEKVKLGIFELDQSEDYIWHTKEFAMNGLPVGTYCMVVQNNLDGKIKETDSYSISVFHVSNLAYVSLDNADASEIFILDRTTGRPLPDVKAEVLEHEYQSRNRNREWILKATLYSDENGRVKFDGDSRNFTFKLIMGSDILDLREYHHVNSGRRSRISNQISVFTDRAIYRPGQSVYYKGLVMTYSEKQVPKIAANEKVKLVWKDANRQVISEQEFNSDSYGGFNGVLKIPTSGLNGQYRLDLTTNNGRSSHSIRVEEYKRPKLLAKMDTLDTSPTLGDTITLTGKVESYGGINIQNARVSYRVEKQEFAWYYRSHFHIPSRGPAEQVIYGITKTNKQGQFSFDIPTKSAGNDYLRYNYVAYVDITDEIGETASVAKSINLGSVPFYLNIEMEEERFEGDKPEINIVSKNADGASLSVDVSIMATALNYPQNVKRNKNWDVAEFHSLDSISFSKMFPLDVYRSESNPDQWPIFNKEKLVNKSGREMIVNDFETLEHGVYRLDFVATDKDDHQVKETRYLHITDRSQKALPTKRLWVSSPLNSYQPGDQIILDVSTPYEDSKVIYRIHYNRSTKETQWMSLNPAGRIEYGVGNQDLGGFSIDIAMVKDNRLYTHKVDINVPWTEKELAIEYVTFRDKIEPGSQENWQLRIKDVNGKNIAGRLTAAMYDASLDQFLNHRWQKVFYPKYRGYHSWRGAGFNNGRTYSYIPHVGVTPFYVQGYTPMLNTFGLLGKGASRYVTHGGFPEGAVFDKAAAPRETMMASTDSNISRRGKAANLQVEAETANDFDLSSDLNDDIPLDDFSIRENLKETVFFMPDLEVKNGVVDLDFTMNEALTKWNLLLFAYDKNFAYTFDSKSIVTQKKLMVEPFLPRFIRQGDKIEFTAKVSNLTEELISANAKIEVLDAVTGESITSNLIYTSLEIPTNVKAGVSETVSWLVNVPEDYNSPVIIRVIVSGGNHTDGEQVILPILSNRILITESQPFHVTKGETQDVVVESLKKLEESKTIESQNYTIELTTNPAWLVVKSIPFLLSNEAPSSLSRFNALYATSLMKHLIQKEPQIKSVLKQWQGANLQSPLTKNQDLKLDDLNETPWVQEALDEEERMSLLSVYLDENYVTSKISENLKSLNKYKLNNGGYSWMPGGKDNWHTTQSILEGLGHLQKLGVPLDYSEVGIEQSVEYLDSRFLEHRKKFRLTDEEHLSPVVLHYLYVRSFFSKLNKSNKVEEEVNKVFKKLEDSWFNYSTYTQGLIAYSALRSGRDSLVLNIKKSLLERLIRNEEVGYYWNDLAGYYWYNSDISKQALMIELFHELDADPKLISNLKLWLLKNKQTNRWRTQSGTSKACYAFLLGEESLIEPNNEIRILLPRLSESIKPNNKELQSGYIRKDFSSSNISASLSDMTIENPSNTDVWGAAYWQYYDDISAVEKMTDTPLSLSKTVFKVMNTDGGEKLFEIEAEQGLTIGDRIRIRLTITADRPMEFVELKDWRGSGVGPINTLSRYKRQDGLGYYETTKDLSTIFYFSRIPKGNWVLEYDLQVTHKGEFVNSLAQIQSVYSPEFGSYSSGVQLRIK